MHHSLLLTVPIITINFHYFSNEACVGLSPLLSLNMDSLIAFGAGFNSYTVFTALTEWLTLWAGATLARHMSI